MPSLICSDFLQHQGTEITDIRRGIGRGPKPAAVTIGRQRADILTSNADKDNGFEQLPGQSGLGRRTGLHSGSGHQLMRAKEAEHEFLPDVSSPRYHIRGVGSAMSAGILSLLFAESSRNSRIKPDFCSCRLVSIHLPTTLAVRVRGRLVRGTPSPLVYENNGVAAASASKSLSIRTYMENLERQGLSAMWTHSHGRSTSSIAVSVEVKSRKLVTE